MELAILTPSGALEMDIDSLTAVDGSGSFGIMARHAEFLSVLKPCILVFGKGGKPGFAVVDGGIMRVEGGRVTVSTRHAVEGESYAGLRDLLASQFNVMEEKEATFRDLLANMEKLLVDRMAKFERGGGG